MHHTLIYARNWQETARRRTNKTIQKDDIQGSIRRALPDRYIKQRKPERKIKMKIIDFSSIQHHIGGAVGTCGDVTGTEDAILLLDYVGYPGIPIELAHKEAMQE